MDFLNTIIPYDHALINSVRGKEYIGRISPGEERYKKFCDIASKTEYVDYYYRGDEGGTWIFRTIHMTLKHCRAQRTIHYKSIFGDDNVNADGSFSKKMVKRTIGHSQDWSFFGYDGRYFNNFEEAIAMAKAAGLKVQLKQGKKTWNNLDDPNLPDPGYVFTQDELDSLKQQRIEIKEHLSKLYPNTSTKQD